MLDAHFPHPPTGEFVPCSTLCRVSCLMTAVASEDQQLFDRKRRRGAIEQEHWATATVHPPRKRAKRRYQSQQDTNTAYWDSLSKLWLTPQALDELERRNKQRSCPIRPATTCTQDLVGDKGQLENPSKNLLQSARHGGPDLRDLGGYPEPSTSISTAHVMPSNQSDSRTQSKSRNTLGDSTARTATSKTKKTSAYDRNFGQNLADNSIYPDDYDFPDGRDPPRPSNENEILKRLGQPRPSLSPSQFPEKAFRTFKQTNSRALNEDAVMGVVFPVIQGDARISSARNIGFGNLEPLTHGNFVNAKPDSYDGAHPAQIDRPIREVLGPYITPSTQQQAPALPNFFTEVKGPDGNGAVAKLQACYDGAIGARGIHKLEAFGMEDPKTVYDNSAYTLTSTYHSATGTLQMYTIHPIQSTNDANLTEYHMAQLGGWALTGSSDQFRQGASAFRNARDWAKEQRDELIAAANSRMMGIPKETPSLEPSTHSVSQSTIQPDAPESETSADEPSQDVSRGSSLSNKRRKRGPEKRSSNPDLRIRPKKSYSGTNSRSRSRGRLSQKR